MGAPANLVLVDPGQDLAGVDGLALFGLEALDRAGLGGAHFVLHFHGLHDEDALARLDFVSGFDQQAHYLTGHGRDDLLAALGFDVSVAAAAPGARIGDLRGELVIGGLQGEPAIRLRGDSNLVGLAVEKDGEDVGGDFHGVGICGLAIEGDLPAVSSVGEFDCPILAGDADFEFHER